METATPEEVGLSSQRLARIRPFMQRYVDQNKLAGLLTLVARHGKIAHFECFGMMDREAGKPMQSDTLVRIYSMTKPVASVAAMMLFEEGRFQLYDPVTNYLPELKNLKVKHGITAKGLQLVDAERDITIHDLLTHTSGMCYEDEPIVGEMYKQIDPQNPSGTLKEMVGKLAQLPLAFQPGSTWRYGLSTDVLGYFVEVVAGMPFDQYLEQKIFQPLGMRDTAFYVPPEKIERFSAMYGPDGSGKLKLIDAPATSTFLPRPTLPGGGWGLVSTAADYVRFCQMLLNGGELDGTRFLSRKTVELMTINHLPERLLPMRFNSPGLEHITNGYGFGLGFRVMMNLAETKILGSAGEYGWGGAASTYFFIDPKEQLIGLLLPQLLPIWTYPVDREFHALVYQAIAD